MTHVPATAAQEIVLLRQSVQDFVARWKDTKALRARRNRLPGFDVDLLTRMRDLGWFGVLIPEKYEGIGLNFAAMQTVIEGLGTGLMAEPLVSTVVLGARAIVHGDNDFLKQALLPRVVRGELMPALAWQETDGGIDLGCIAMCAEISGATVRLSGRKRFVAGVTSATGFVVAARIGGDIGSVWVEAGDAGLNIEHEWRIDGTPSGLLILHNLQVPRERIISTSSIGLRRALDEATVMASAELLGIMRALLTMTVEYMRTRVQYGRPIGAFQALQHRAVDLYVQQELASAVVADAVAALDRDEGAFERTRFASRAKARCSDAGLRIGREAVQLHGAIGFTDECDVGLYLKRAMVLSAWLGNADRHRRRFLALSDAHGSVSTARLTDVRPL